MGCYDALVPFETFKRQRAPATGEPAITIQKRGTFSINVPAYEALGSPKAVELLYDRENQLVALRSVDLDAEYAYVVRPLGKGNSTWLISGMAFTAYYGIATDVARRWIARAEDGLLVIDLKEPGVEVTSGRTGRGDEPHEELRLEVS